MAGRAGNAARAATPGHWSRCRTVQPEVRLARRQVPPVWSAGTEGESLHTPCDGNVPQHDDVVFTQGRGKVDAGFHPVNMRVGPKWNVAIVRMHGFAQHLD